jgi:hypothetical protein
MTPVKPEHRKFSASDPSMASEPRDPLMKPLAKENVLIAMAVATVMFIVAKLLHHHRVYTEACFYCQISSAGLPSCSSVSPILDSQEPKGPGTTGTRDHCSNQSGDIMCVQRPKHVQVTFLWEMIETFPLLKKSITFRIHAYSATTRLRATSNSRQQPQQPRSYSSLYSR